MAEIIPKPAEKTSAWQSLLFYLSFILLLGTVAAFFVLDIFLNKGEANLRKLEETLQEEKTAEEIALEKEVFGYQTRMKDFAKLASEHLFSSKLLTFIEENTLPQVWFSKGGLNLASGEVKLTGETENFLNLAQQIQIFRQNSLVNNFYLTKATIGKEGRVNFDLTLNLNSSIFK